MPVIACGACTKRMNVPDTVLGKAVKCPGCGQVVKTAAAAPVPAQAAKASTPAAKVPAAAAKAASAAVKSPPTKPAAKTPPAMPEAKAPPPVPPAGPIVVECSTCGGRVRGEANQAGQTVKCSTCDEDVILPGTAPAGSAPSDPSPEVEESESPTFEDTPEAPTPPPASIAPPEPPAVPADPPKPQLISFACAGCKNKLKVNDTLGRQEHQVSEVRQGRQSAGAAPATSPGRARGKEREGARRLGTGMD